MAIVCRQRDLNPMQTDLKEILNFLVELYEAGLGYSGINTARSMLSSFVLIPKDIGKNNLIKRFMKGVFELKTPRPQRCHVWDVSMVFQYVKSLGGNAELTLKYLTYKVVILAAIISAQRVQTLHLLDLDFMDITEQSFVFYINDKLKQTRPGHVGMQICFNKFSEDELLCIYSVLKVFIEKTENLRTSSRLFISYRKPHDAITRETLSRWIKAVLTASGVDTSVFTAHSTRAASTSAAYGKNVPVPQILSTADWSNASTFAKFYKKKVLQNYFANVLLE